MSELNALPGMDPFGKGLKLEDGDLAFEYNADGLLTLKTIASIDNLAQGLRILVKTPLGSDIFNQLFGFDLHSILQGDFNLTMTKQLIRLHVVKAISSDDRILRIQDMVFDDAPAYMEQNPEADPAEIKRRYKRSRRWQLDVMIQPANGETALIPIEVSDF